MKWKQGMLQDLVFFQRGFDISKAEQNPGSVPVISSSGIQSYHSESKAKAPGVAIGRKGTLGSIHYTDIDYWPHSTTLWSKRINGNPRYIYYFLHTLKLERFDVGNSNPTLNRNHIHNLKIKIPPLEIQNKIADILSRYDETIANNRRRIELLERSSRLLYREWFVHLRYPGHEHGAIGSDGIPEGWKKKKIENVCETVGGGTPSTKNPDYWDGDITWVVPTDITRNNCLALLNSERKITEKGLKESSAKMLPPETILMTSRASVGFFALVDREVCTNQGFISIVPYQTRLQMYLLHNLMYRVEEIRSHAGGTTYAEISKTRFRNLDIVIPSKLLLEQFQEQAHKIFQQVQLLQKQNQKLQAARDLLLPRLMNGEINV